MQRDTVTFSGSGIISEFVGRQGVKGELGCQGFAEQDYGLGVL